jgi:hypothetical protein
MITTCGNVLTNRQNIVSECINEVLEEKPNLKEDGKALLDAANARVIRRMLEYFPQMVEDARAVNRAKYKILEEEGRKGKFTDTYGWSADGSFLFDFDIPPDLYYFMQTCVYRYFWAEDNERVWRSFMKKICKSAAAMTELEIYDLLVKVKQIYGPNSDRSLT